MDNEKYSYSFSSPDGGFRRPEPEKSRGGLGGRVVALCLSCTLLGGAVGGVAGWVVSDANKSAPSAYEQSAPSAPQAQQSAQPVATSGAGALSIAQIYAKCNPSVVAIATEGTQYNVFGQSATFASAGSGFITSQDGYIITNAHVISGSNTITVMLYNGETVDAHIIGQDSDADLAVLKIEKTGLTPVTFGDSDNLVVGTQVIAIGNPLGELANTMTTGVISALDREINIDGTPMNMLQTDASISPGNSGGPLIDSSGNVVGVVSAKSSGSGVEGIGFAIPINDVRDTVEQLMQYGYVRGRAKLGLSIDPSYTAAASRYFNMPEGCYVGEVESGSAAEKAGIEKGDIITALAGQAVKSFEDLQSVLAQHKAGETANITINRAGSEKSLSIVFGEKLPQTQETPVPSQESSGNPYGDFGSWQQNGNSGS